MTSFTKELWHPTEAGILMPSGSISEASNRKKTNLLHVKARAKEIEDLFAAARVAMSPTCGLAQLIRNAQAVADRWFSNQTADSSMLDVFYALHLERLADAILPLRDVPTREKYLNALTSGDLIWLLVSSRTNAAGPRSTVGESEIPEPDRERGGALLSDGRSS